MEVLKTNFEETLATIEALTQKTVTFLSLDCEFTGIRGRSELMTDTPDERYDKMRAVAERYQLIQLGLCFFVLRPEDDKPPDATSKQIIYDAYPFNVYLFPEERSGARTEIVFDIDTINFHKQQKLDFNKWIYDGVPYISAKAERMMLAKLMEEKVNDEELNLSEDDTKKIAQIIEDIKKWIGEGAKEELVVSGLNSFLRKYLYQKLAKDFPQVYHEAKQVGKFDKQIILKVIKEEEKKLINETKKQEGLKEIQRKSGALKLFKILGKLKVPVIGHNPLFDLLFLYSHLHDELPQSLSEFKKQINELFPVIYDTMLLFGNERVKKLLPEKQSSALEAVYLFLSKASEMTRVTINTTVSRYAKDEFYHEAGFDSYITGYCFAKMKEYIGLEEVEKYKNQLYIHRVHYNLNLTGKETLYESTLIYVGKLVEGKSLDNLHDRLKECKELYYAKAVNSDMAFFVIRRNDGHEKVIEMLKQAPELMSLKDWLDYVEERKNCIGAEEKKEPSKKWGNKARESVPKNPTSAQLRPKLTSEHQEFTPQYNASQPQMYPCYPSTANSQGYSYQYYYNVYPRSPYQ